MGLRFRKRVKIAPGVYLNMSKSGVSTTLKAGKGLSVNMGKDGTYLNTGIPGTGVYSREKISGNKQTNVMTNNKGNDNSGCWFGLWGLLSLVSLGAFIVGWFAEMDEVTAVGAGGFILFGVFAYISNAIGKKRTRKSFEEKTVENISKKMSQSLMSETDANTTSREVHEPQMEALSNRQKMAGVRPRPIVTKENVEKLLAPREKPKVFVPDDYDPLFSKAMQLVVDENTASMAFLQRKLQIGATRAGKIMEELEQSRVVGGQNGNRPRKVLIQEPTDADLIAVARYVISSNIVLDSLIQGVLNMGYERVRKSLVILEKAGIVSAPNQFNHRSVLVYNEKEFQRLVNEKLQKDLDRSLHNIENLKKETAQLISEAERILSNSQRQDHDELIVADEIFELCQQLGDSHDFTEELSKHYININGSDGKPLFGENGKVRSLFFLDIAHCYLEMVGKVDLKQEDGLGILYLMFRLFSPGTSIPHDRQHLDVIKGTLPNGAESIINQMKVKPFFKDGEIDFTVAAILNRCDKNAYNKYLTLLFRYCSLIAKSDGNVTDKEQRFLDHIAQLRTISTSRQEKVTIQNVQSMKQNGIAELDGLIGLDSVKQEVRTMANFIKIQQSRQQQGLKVSHVSYHCVFTGNPGTGKTTVARILAGIYNELGVLKKGHLVETDRSGLVAEYVGQTAVKTNKVIDNALDGVLFIDEAYSLIAGSGNDYGHEAIATLLKRMEDDRERLIVILAGYGEEMKQFIDSNPGLQSRFNRYIKFPDYSADELRLIFHRYVQKNDYEITPEADEKIKDLLEEAVGHKDKNFGNGRYVRNLFEKTLEQQANRLATVEHPTLKQLKEICPTDIIDGFGQ